jgi:uncharacterized DUF497 family protein
MDFSFDPGKNVQNLEKHKLPLAFGVSVLMNMVGEVEDRRRDYGEKRMKAFAQFGGSWFQCTYTMRGTVAHIINVHRTSSREMRKWLNPSG